MSVAALCVGAPDTAGEAPPTALHPMADFSHLPTGAAENWTPYLSTEALSDAEPFQGEGWLASGIHLHWALPEGLTRAVQQEGSGRADFPSVPNRWLVTRMILHGGGDVSSKTWIVESDRCSYAAGATHGLKHPTIPLEPGPPLKPSFAYLGASWPLEEWGETEDAERLRPLTAVGYGEPAFAGFYPNASTVFGFHDNLGDAGVFDYATARVCYHVAGWYSDPVTDPLAGGDVEKVVDRLHWTLRPGATPTATICTGVVDGISWNPGTAYLDAAAHRIKVSVGSSPPDSVAALLSAVVADRTDVSARSAEQTLNALQFGLLSAEPTPDAVAEFEEALHAAGFGRLRGGSLWSITARGSAGASDDPEEVTLPEWVASELNALNDLQAQLDAAVLECVSLRYQLFVDWHKYLVVEYDPADVPTELVNALVDVKSLLAGERDAIAALAGSQGTIGTLQQQIETRASTLGGALPQSMELVRTEDAPHYYRPNDPVVTLWGDDVSPVDRSGVRMLGVRSALACRTGDEIVKGVAVDASAVPGSPGVAVTTADLPRLSASPPDAPVEILTGLLDEAVLIAPSLQPLVSKVAADKSGAAADAAATATVLEGAAGAFVGGRTTPGISYTGTPPHALAVSEWDGTPWLPMILQYEVEVRPVEYLDAPSGAGSYASDCVLEQFDVEPSTVDFVYTGDELPESVETYSGTALLTTGGHADLLAEIDRYLGASGDDADLQTLRARFATLPLLAQSLAGFNEAMLMRKSMLQVPVADPFATDPRSQEFVRSVSDAVGDQRYAGPRPETSFAPVRAGALRVLKLRLIDAFGRFKDYELPETVYASTLAPPAAAPPDAGFLPPRINQPARLLFRWLAASDDAAETNSHPATSPVIGWVVPSYLDRSLVLYDSDGGALGEIGLGLDGATSLWTPAPGGGHPGDATIDESLAGVNAHLREFARSAYADGDATFLAPFFEAVEEALALVLPKDLRQDAAAVLIGQPLVLARASLSLDLMGPPASDESWTAFADVVLNGADENDGGLSGLRFPVVLGFPDKLNDSLVGYWLDREAAPDYSTFYSAAAPSGVQGVVRPDKDTITLSPLGPPVMATLLLDPRGNVHATTGVLPVKAIQIPADHYAAAASTLSVSFAVRPILSGSDAGVVLPQPKVAAGEWAFVTVTAGGWAAQAVKEPLADASLDYSRQRIFDGWLSLRPAPAPASTNGKEAP